MRRAAKPKKVTIELVERERDGEVALPYRIMDALIAAHHPHLAEARIAIAWRIGWKVNRDGYVHLGQCKKGSELDRSLHGYDFVILLNKDSWPTLDPNQAEALIDHELCHAAVSLDSDGETKRDELGRILYRTRRHDIEEFHAVVRRHGIHKANIEAFAQSTAEAATHPLLPSATEREAARRTPAISDGDAVRAAPTSWRAIRLSDPAPIGPGINGRASRALIEAGIVTVGDLHERQERGDHWAADIRGLGPAGREEIEDRMEAFWAEHPEYCGAAVEGDV